MRFTQTPVLRKFSIALLGALIGGSANAQPETPMIKEVSVEIICPLTGPNSKVPTLMKTLDLCGTDLGIMTEADGRIFFAFGDTFGYPCSGPGGPNWRSNTLGATANHNPDKWRRVDGLAHQLRRHGQSDHPRRSSTAVHWQTG